MELLAYCEQLQLLLLYLLLLLLLLHLLLLVLDKANKSVCVIELKAKVARHTSLIYSMQVYTLPTTAPLSPLSSHSPLSLSLY